MCCLAWLEISIKPLKLKSEALAVSPAAQGLSTSAKSFAVQQFLQAVTGEQADNGLDDAAIDALITERHDAKASKNFARADEIREQLKQAGIELEDSRAGTTWRRA